MVFKRRDKPSLGRRLQAWFYPPGGWKRAFSYNWHRLRRLPDRPGRIARGVACGVFVCFTPFFGFHFLIAVLLAWLIQGNKIAAFLSTFVGNPLTFPLIAAMSIELGETILRVDTPIPLAQVLPAFAGAFGELTSNLVSIVTRGGANWDQLQSFFFAVVLPYAVGGFLPGLVAAVLSHAITLRLVHAYQARRMARARKKLAAAADKRPSTP